MGLGMAGVVGTSEAWSRRSGLMIALSFFAGIVISLTLLGAMAGHLGALLTESFSRSWALVMALMSFAAAIIALREPGLKVSQLAAVRSPGIIGAFSYGFVFSIGTSVAPLLLLLTLAAAHGRPGYGLALSLAFGLGRGLPFLIVSAFSGAAVRFIRAAAWRRAIHFISVGALLLLGAYYAWVFISLL